MWTLRPSISTGRQVVWRRRMYRTANTSRATRPALITPQARRISAPQYGETSHTGAETRIALRRCAPEAAKTPAPDGWRPGNTAVRISVIAGQQVVTTIAANQT